MLHYFICIATVKSLQFSRLFQSFLSNNYFWNAFVNPKRKNYMWKLWYSNYKKQYCTSQEEIFSWNTVLYPMYCTQNDLTYHIAKKHSVPKPDVTFTCELCYQGFPGFYALRQHRNNQHGMKFGCGTREVDVEHFLVDSELERARHKVFNYAVESLNETIVNEKLDHFFNNLKCAAKVNLAFGSILKNIEGGGFRYFYAHENNTLLDRFKLVCTHDDLAKLKDFLNQTDVIEPCSRERTNTKWRFYKLTNLTVFAALLKDLPMGCKDAVLPEPLLKICTINCLTFEETTRQAYNNNLCLFGALALHLHGNQRLEKRNI